MNKSKGFIYFRSKISCTLDYERIRVTSASSLQQLSFSCENGRINYSIDVKKTFDLEGDKIDDF
jgi:hypothetical protein